jgi:hypothetical protein
MSKCCIYVCSKDAIFDAYWCVEHAIDAMKYNYSIRPDAGLWINYGDDLREAIIKHLKKHPEEALEF